MAGLNLNINYKGAENFPTFWKISTTIFKEIGDGNIETPGPYFEFHVDCYMSEAASIEGPYVNRMNDTKICRITDINTIQSILAAGDVPAIQTFVYNLLKSFTFPGESTPFFANATDA